MGKFKKFLKVVGKDLKEGEKAFYKKLTTPPSKKEKADMARALAASNALLDSLSGSGADMFGGSPSGNHKHIHEFVMSDTKSRKLKCKHCGKELTAKSLGKEFGQNSGKEKKKQENAFDADDILRF